MRIKSYIVLFLITFFLLAKIFSLPIIKSAQANNKVLSQHEISLSERYKNKDINKVFKDNILLNMAYLSGRVQEAADIDWSRMDKPFKYQFVLQPGEVFAFHEDVMENFIKKKVITTKSHFNAAEGYLSDGYLYGDGVCHLASIINWVAQEAGLEVLAPTSHDFAFIPEVPRQYGVSIYFSPGESSVNQQQNLYIENNLNKEVIFIFDYKNNILRVSASTVN